MNKFLAYQCFRPEPVLFLIISGQEILQKKKKNIVNLGQSKYKQLFSVRVKVYILLSKA